MTSALTIKKLFVTNTDHLEPKKNKLAKSRILFVPCHFLSYKEKKKICSTKRLSTPPMYNEAQIHLYVAKCPCKGGANYGPKKYTEKNMLVVQRCKKKQTFFLIFLGHIFVHVYPTYKIYTLLQPHVYNFLILKHPLF